MLRQLDKIMIEHGLNKSTLSKNSDIPYTTIVNFYEKGTDNVKLSTLRKLSKYFEVPLDYWDDESDINIQNAESNKKKLSTDEECLLDSYRKLNDFGKQVARLNLEGMSRQHDYAILKSDTFVELSQELA